MSLLTEVITASGDARDQSLDTLCRDLSLEQLLAECQALDRFRRSSDNLYERVRALFRSEEHTSELQSRVDLVSSA